MLQPIIYLMVDFLSKKKQKNYARMFDTTGMQVYTGNYYTKQFEINVALTAGVYLLKIENGELTGISQTKKIVVTY